MRTETPATTPRNKAAPRASSPQADARRWTSLDGAIVLSFALEVMGAVVAALLGRGWVTALVLDLVVGGVLCLYATRARWRPLVARLLVFGVIAGCFELFTDFAGERVAHSLVYPVSEPLLWTSPIYMPLSWMIVLTQIGYLAWRLDGLLPRRAMAVVLVGLWGALNIPFYEAMAYAAGWWRYRDAPGIAHTPLYVLLFEGLVVAPLPLLLHGFERQSWRGVVMRAATLGVWMPWAAFIAWLALGR